MNKKQITAFAKKIIDSWLVGKINSEKIPNFSIEVSFGGEVIMSDSYGSQGSAKSNIIPIASITKTLTALLILKLIEKKKIKLDDKASSYLDWLLNKGKNAKELTIRDLLSHQSGIARDIYGTYFSDLKFPGKGELENAFTEIFKKHVVGFKYSNLGYAILGQVIEMVAGKSYFDFLQEEILIPLKINSAKLITKDGSSGYSLIGGNLKKEGGPTDVGIMDPAFGLAMSMDDIHRLFQALSQGAIGKKLFKNFYPAEFGEDYGLGLYRTLVGRNFIYSSNGSLFGRQAFACFDKKNDVVITMEADLRQASLESMAFGVMDIFHRAIKYPKYHFAKTHKGIDRYNGLYRSMAGELVLCGYGDKIFAFTPSVNNPLLNAMHIGYTDKGYKILSASRHAEIGERIDFTENDKGIALRIGAVEYKKTV